MEGIRHGRKRARSDPDSPIERKSQRRRRQIFELDTTFSEIDVDSVPTCAPQNSAEFGSNFDSSKARRYLGGGLSGHVFSATNPRKPSPVAIKVFKPSMPPHSNPKSPCSTPDESLAREMYLSRKLGVGPRVFHACIDRKGYWRDTDTNNVGNSENVGIIVMESGRGSSEHKMAFYELAEDPDIQKLVERMHQHGIFHGDLHPGNVIYTDRGPAIIDTGSSFLRGVNLSTNKRKSEELFDLDTFSVPFFDLPILTRNGQECAFFSHDRGDI